MSHETSTKKVLRVIKKASDYVVPPLAVVGAVALSAEIKAETQHMWRDSSLQNMTHPLNTTSSENYSHEMVYANTATLLTASIIFVQNIIAAGCRCSSTVGSYIVTGVLTGISAAAVVGIDAMTNPLLEQSLSTVVGPSWAPVAKDAVLYTAGATLTAAGTLFTLKNSQSYSPRYVEVPIIRVKKIKKTVNPVDSDDDPIKHHNSRDDKKGLISHPENQKNRFCCC